MGLMCSLRGHDWSETELEDDRDERGNEVVMTVREYEVCSRCDARNLVSENTEVTSVARRADEAEEPADEAGAADAEASTADEPAADATDRAEPTASTETEPGEGDVEATDAIVDAETDDAIVEAEPDEASAASADDGAIIVDDGDDADDADDDELSDGNAPAPEKIGGADAEIVEGSAGPDADEPVAHDESTDPHADPATDDGVILPGDDGRGDEDVERAHGEWPDHETNEPAASESPSNWPDHEDGDGLDAEVQAEAAGEGDGDGEPQPSAPDDGGEPEKGYDAEFVDDAAARSSQSTSGSGSTGRTRLADDSPTGIASAGEVTAPSEGTSTSANAQLVCPACDNAESRSRTSLRAGDICPECKRGYLTETTE